MLILVQGLPGSGKSTFARSLALALGAQHLETDMYFLRGGNYKFDAKRLGQAHAWCQYQTHLFLEKGLPVIVSNTFTRPFETRPFEKIAEKLGVDFQVFHVDPGLTPEQLHDRCLHNVPLETIKKMAARWETHPAATTLRF